MEAERLRQSLPISSSSRDALQWTQSFHRLREESLGPPDLAPTNSEDLQYTDASTDDESFESNLRENALLTSSDSGDDSSAAWEQRSDTSVSDGASSTATSIDNDDCNLYTSFSSTELGDPDQWQFPDRIVEDVVNNLIWKLDYHVSDTAYENAPLYVGDHRQQRNPSLYEAKKIIRQLTRIESRLIPCCINSCAAFLDDTAISRTESCSFCHEAIYETVKLARKPVPVVRARQHFLYMSPISRLILEFAQENLAKELSVYRQTMDQMYSPSHMRDYFDGEHFRQCKNDGLFTNIRDIALSISTDGVNITRQKSHSTWPITCTILNYPPELRYKRMMLLGLTPGPKEPKDLASFFKPLLNDLEKLSAPAGIRCYDAATKAVFSLHAYVCVVTGDTPAIAKMMSMGGANSIVPCRSCYIRGERDTSVKSHNYYPMKKRIIGTDIRLQTSMREQILLVADAGDDSLNKDTGITGLSFLLPIRTLDFPRSFGLDSMHLVSNVAKMFWLLWTGNFKTYNGNTSLDKFILTKAQQETIGTELKRCRTTVPVSVSRHPRDISKNYGSFKATEWFEWITMYSLPLLTDKLPDYALSSWSFFVAGVRLLLKVSLTSTEIDQIQLYMNEFIRSTEAIYYQDHANCLAICTTQLHGLAHVADNIRYLGPAHVTWQFSLERFVGTLERLATSKARISRSMYNSLQYLEHVKYARELYPVKAPCKAWRTQNHLEQEVFEDGSVIARVSRALPQVFDARFVPHLRQYYSEVLHGFERCAAVMNTDYYKIRRMRLQVAFGTTDEYVLESEHSQRHSGRRRSSVAFWDYKHNAVTGENDTSISYGLIMSIFCHQPLRDVRDHPNRDYRKLLMRIWRYNTVVDPRTEEQYYLGVPNRNEELIVLVRDVIEPIGVIKRTCEKSARLRNDNRARMNDDQAPRLETRYYIAKGNRIQTTG